MVDLSRLAHLVMAPAILLATATMAQALPPAPVALAAPGTPGAGLAPVAGLVLVWDDRVTRTRDLPTLALQQARRRMLAGQSISYDDMRALADHGDGLAAFRYANRLMDLDQPDVLSAAAHYYATAALTGRDYAIWPLIRLLRRDDIAHSPARLRHLEQVLRQLAESGNEPATTALTRFYATGQPFGPRDVEAAELQRRRARSGDAGAAMTLVVHLMSGQGRLRADAEEIDAWFATLAAHGDPGQRAISANMRRLYDIDPTRYATSTPVALQEEQP